MTGLDRAELRRLVGCLGLLSSPVAGERDAAALAASRIVASRGLTWAALLQPALPPPPVQAQAYPEPTGWRTDLALCARHPGELRPWESRFVADMQHRFKASPKQRWCLKRIAERLRERGRT